MNVSVVIPTYKRPDYLDRLLASIARQTISEFEVIVVDDNSPNLMEYEPVIEKYSKVFKEFTFTSNENNRGAPYSRNRGIRLAKYDLIALVDDDDEWLPEKLARQVDLFRLSPSNVGLVYTWTDAINEKGEIVHRYRAEIEGNAIKEILTECFIPSPSVMVRKAAIVEAGLFDETFPSCQDWDMWTRLLAKNYSCYPVKRVLTLYHKHEDGNIGMSETALNGYRLYYKKHINLGIRKFNFHYLKTAISLKVKSWL